MKRGAYLFCLATSTAHADATALDKVCAEVLCRPATTSRVRTTPLETLELSWPRRPYYADGALNILPGETLYLEGEEKDGKLVKLRAVDKPGPRTIIVKLEQLSDPKLDRQTMLTVTNPFGGPLRYHAGIQRASADTIARTTSCAVKAGTKSYEHWPEPVVLVVMTDLRLVDAREAGRCD